MLCWWINEQHCLEYCPSLWWYVLTSEKSMNGITRNIVSFPMCCFLMYQGTKFCRNMLLSLFMWCSLTSQWMELFKILFLSEPLWWINEWNHLEYFLFQTMYVNFWWCNGLHYSEYCSLLFLCTLMNRWTHYSQYSCFLYLYSLLYNHLKEVNNSVFPYNSPVFKIMKVVVVGWIWHSSFSGYFWNLLLQQNCRMLDILSLCWFH